MTIRKILFLTFLAVVLPIIIYAGALIFLTHPISEFSIDKAGVFGDSFGILTSLFSGLAFGGIIITTYLQSKELQHQREELRLQREEISRNREEMARSANAQEKSEESFSMQVRMMGLSALVDVIKLKNTPGSSINRKMIDGFHKELIGLLEKSKIN